MYCTIIHLVYFNLKCIAFILQELNAMKMEALKDEKLRQNIQENRYIKL